MENTDYQLMSRNAAARAVPVLVGVTASGNCEVLVESGAPAGRCEVRVRTSAVGFGSIWQAVLDDFAERRAAGGLRIEIHDVGATPAVVGLRLDQALETWEEGDA